jgi:ABC-type bacteriocin/lantibiotic exporter with double-glycine peptidase domain
MPKLFSNQHFPEVKRVVQKTSSHCGPAVLEMLLSFVGKDIDQEEVVNAVNIADKLLTHGMFVSEMGNAVRILAPDMQFWFKQNSSLSDLRQLVMNYKYPAGVEWQGVFYEDEDDDNGHYCVVTYIDTSNNIIMLADPYKRFAGSDRIFHILEFEDRWWDENEIRDPETGSTRYERDYHTMIVVTPKEETWPEELEMTRG